MQAQVYKIHSDFYYVKNSKHIEFVCKLREILKKQKIDICVGDFVELSADNLFINKLLKRKNHLLRPKVSNIDSALVLCAIKEPDVNYIQLNRYLAYLKYNNIEAAVCFNKEDLIDNISSYKKEVSNEWSKIGFKTFFISAKNASDLDELLKFIKGKTIVLCGESGVGKSTLLNCLCSDICAKTGLVSQKTKRGCHTTRHCEIIETSDFKIIDTPGFSCLKFDFLLPEKIIDLFDDIKKYSNKCKYSNCLHDTEKKGVCSVVDNLDKIEKMRYESYLCFLEEAKTQKENLKNRSTKKESLTKITGKRESIKISKKDRSLSRKTDKQKMRANNEID